MHSDSISQAIALGKLALAIARAAEMRRSVCPCRAGENVSNLLQSS